VKVVLLKGSAVKVELLLLPPLWEKAWRWEEGAVEVTGGRLEREPEDFPLVVDVFDLLVDELDGSGAAVFVFVLAVVELLLALLFSFVFVLTLLCEFLLFFAFFVAFFVVFVFFVFLL
jgi:hypothetical protein